MNASPLKSLAAGIGVVAAALSFAACGSDDSSGSGASKGSEDFVDQSGREIAEDAVAAMKGVKSLRMKGDITDDGQKMSLDFTIDETSGNCSGSFAQGDKAAELISLGEEQYMKADGAFWTSMADTPQQGSQLATMLGGKWVKVPTSSEDFGELCDLDELLGEFSEGPDKDDRVTKGEVDTVDGRKAVILIGEEDGEKSRIWVAVEGDHHILKIEVVGGDEPGTIEFSGINEPADIKAPAEDQVVDMTG